MVQSDYHKIFASIQTPKLINPDKYVRLDCLTFIITFFTGFFGRIIFPKSFLLPLQKHL